jgi:diaminopropionate ammonia-lyase
MAVISHAVAASHSVIPLLRFVLRGLAALRGRTLSGMNPATLWDNERPTSLVELPTLARHIDIGRVFAKLENERPLGNFKALGGRVAVSRALAKHPSLPRLICASDGNHGLSVAAAAAKAGATATIYLPTSASPIRADRIESAGGEIHWINGTYDDAVSAAAAAAERGEGLLIPDTSPDPNDPVVEDVMAGYGILTQELRNQLPVHPTHLFVQAGVGGLAAAMARGLRDFMSGPRRLVIVEPGSAACVCAALTAGHPVLIAGPLQTCAEMLSCGLASASAIQILQQHDAHSILINEHQLQTTPALLSNAGGPPTTPSGAAGLAGLLHAATDPTHRANLHLTPTSTVLFIITEGPTSP